MSRSAKKTENLEIPDVESKVETKIDPMQFLIKEMQDMKSSTEKLSTIVAFLLEKDAESGRNSPKKEAPSTGTSHDVIDITPPSDKTQVILSAAPPPFTRVLKELQNPFEYWIFIKAYKDYKLKYPSTVQHMRLVQHIDPEVLHGPLNLTDEMEAAAGTLLPDARISRAADSFFQLTHTTERQFLDLIQKITFEPAAYDKRSNSAMQASQPLFSYLNNVAQFYQLLREMLPGAVPREDDYDRALRTTVKHIVNSNLTRWWPWWSTNIWPTFSKSKERYWSEISMAIIAKCRGILATFYPVQPLMETLTAFSPNFVMSKQPAETKPATRPLWQPNAYKRDHQAKVQPSAARVHMLEDASAETDFELQYEAAIADGLNPDTDNSDEEVTELYALGGEPAEKNLCFSKLIKGFCVKTDCPHKHDKASIDAMARAILARPT
jgi:hypothetical protein